VGPDGQPHQPSDRAGRVYNFTVEPNFASGDYHFRFERLAGDQTSAQTETPALLRIETQKRLFKVGAVAHPLQANFAGYVALLGYDLPVRRVEAGHNIPVTLYWQAVKPIGADLIMFNHLIDRNQKIWGGRDRRAREVYSTLLWAPGEIVVDSFDVQVDFQAPHGLYNLLIGIYLPMGQASVSLPLLQNGQMSQITNVSLSPIKVGPTLPDLTVKSANPQVSLEQAFGDPPSLTLLGYDRLEPAGGKCRAASASCQVSIAFYWRSDSQVSTDYTTFVHVRDAAGQTVAQKDQQPLNGAYPTGLWSPGEIIADRITFPVPAHLSPGQYDLVVGMYDFQTNQRLAMPGHLENSLSLGSLEIGP
jgi:hypothetical protein